MNGLVDPAYRNPVIRTASRERAPRLSARAFPSGEAAKPNTVSSLKSVTFTGFSPPSGWNQTFARSLGTVFRSNPSPFRAHCRMERLNGG